MLLYIIDFILGKKDKNTDRLSRGPDSLSVLYK